MGISKADLTDTGEIVKLVNSAYRGEEARRGWTNEADILRGGVRVREQDVEEMIGGEDSMVLKYVADGIIQACVYLKLYEDHVYLGMLTVSPQLQGKGIGKILLAAAEQVASQHRKTAIRMTVISIRKELIDWYKRHGYRETGETAPFPYREGYGEPAMELEFLVLEKKL